MKLGNATEVILMSFSSVLLLLTGFAGTDVGMSPADDLAIKGYDTVAYFKAGKALKGNESFPFQWHGIDLVFFNQREQGSVCGQP